MEDVFVSWRNFDAAWLPAPAPSGPRARYHLLLPPGAWLRVLRPVMLQGGAADDAVGGRR